MKRFLSGLLVCVAIGASVTPAVVVAAAPRTPFAVAAVFPPWWSAERVEAAAGALGTIESRGAAPSVVVIVGDAGLEQRARRSGAVWLADPSFIRFCLPR